MNEQKINAVIDKACSRIAPAWPLKNFVAVNPYLGLSDFTFSEAAELLAERANISLTLPIPFYLDQYDQGNLTAEDINHALNKNRNFDSDLENFIGEAKFLAARGRSKESFRVRTIIDLAEEITGKDWSGFMVDKVSTWASTYFDEFQSGGESSENQNLYESWRKDALIDLSPRVKGLKYFNSTIKKLPIDGQEATRYMLKVLNISEDIAEVYLHALLLRLIGWSSYSAGQDYHNKLYSGSVDNLRSFLNILLAWELCFYENYKNLGIEKHWEIYKLKLQSHELLGQIDDHLECSLILQEAFDIACQRQLKSKFESNSGTQKEESRAKAQAVFCIDVRSEIYRRSLESIDEGIETIGFAGFFGFPINYVPLAYDNGKNQCPVLIPAGPKVKETFSKEKDAAKAKKTRIVKHQVEKTWKNFKSGAISSFGFVSPLGLTYLPKLISDSFGWTRPASNPNEDGLSKWIKKGRELDLSEIELKDKIKMASSALLAMGLKDNMAPLVCITGHGSSSVNNPHATGLDCGACGGHSGEINAMTAEKILNDPLVREGLLNDGINIPSDTHFIACLHDTTTDEIHIIGKSKVPKSHQGLLKEMQEAFEMASKKARQERAYRLNIKTSEINSSIIKRSKDWSQVRPEWGLAGCNSFVVAARDKTKGVNFEGKAFLHSYDWKTDEGFKVLESIMTAPMVVTSWINLQYYASTTDNKHFGAGNKTLHNVTGGIGVLEGSGGDLRIGLPLQSIHDGKKYQHLPQRLNVIIDAPLEAMNDILSRNSNIKELCDNSWISLFQLNEYGKIGMKYSGDLDWSNIGEEIEQKEELLSV